MQEPNEPKPPGTDRKKSSIRSVKVERSNGSQNLRVTPVPSGHAPVFEQQMPKTDPQHAPEIPLTRPSGPMTAPPIRTPFASSPEAKIKGARLSSIAKLGLTAAGLTVLILTFLVPSSGPDDISDVMPLAASVIPAPTKIGSASAVVPATMPVAVSNPAPVPGPVLPTARRSYPANPELKLLTGGNYAPFTDQDLPGEGMVTELVHAALDSDPSPVTYSVTWDNDWSGHLFPLLNDKTFDVGFPWLKPDCQATPSDERCTNFLYSDPVISLPIMLFVREDNQFSFNSDADIVGKRLCRPQGYFTHDLERSDRRWLSKGLITLVEGKDPADCFRQVLMGNVDAATVNLFLGARLILDMDLRNAILPLEKPLSQEGLYLVTARSHWRGKTYVSRINAGLQKLKDEGRYQDIVSRHMELFRSQLQ